MWHNDQNEIFDQFLKTVFLGFLLLLVVLGLVQILDLVYNRFFSLFVFVLVAVATVVPVVVLALTPLVPRPKPLHLTAVTIASAICNVQNGRATLIQCFYDMLLPFPQGCQFSCKMVHQGSHSL